MPKEPKWGITNQEHAKTNKGFMKNSKMTQYDQKTRQKQTKFMIKNQNKALWNKNRTNQAKFTLKKTKQNKTNQTEERWLKFITKMKMSHHKLKLERNT